MAEPAEDLAKRLLSQGQHPFEVVRELTVQGQERKAAEAIVRKIVFSDRHENKEVAKPSVLRPRRNAKSPVVSPAAPRPADEPSGVESHRPLGVFALICEHLKLFAGVVVGLILVILYFGRELWVGILAELLAQRLGWRVWICECLVWIGVFLVLGVIGLIIWALGFVDDEPPAQTTTPNPHGRCPKCGFEYLWDGDRCGHCAHTQ